MPAEDIGAVDDFEPGRPKVVEYQGRQVAVVRWGADIFALRNVCPHQAESFAGGRAHSVIECGSDLGEFRISGRGVLACPRHMWTFDLHDGRCTVDPTFRVRTFLVTVQEGRVILHDTPRTAGVVASSDSE